MRVFKFGGASVKDANAVRNVARIVSMYNGDKLGVVISAMGKTTNAMEQIVRALWDRNETEFCKLVEERRKFHTDILEDLFPSEKSEIHSEIDNQFDQLLRMYSVAVPDNFNYEYDQVVSIGEIVSTKIVNAYLIDQNVNSRWTDARKLVRTNNCYREAEVDWEKTKILFEKEFLPGFDQYDVQVVQGFIGHTSEGYTTTLGREGSDFTAAIVAYCCDSEDVTIWKDVPGMLNADPKWFDNTVKLDSISFKEAIELAYYGASVIHPKTIKPIQNKEIPLFVKSFLNPEKDGTIIQSSTTNDHLVPSFIFKMNQVLVSITPKDFSFIVEQNLSDIFGRLSMANAKINIMQNSALNFSVLLDEEKTNLEDLLNSFEDAYFVKFNTGLELVTIRHYDQETLERVTNGKDVLLEQKTRETARLVVKEK
jgi:aspartate kinase